ncbi:peptidase M17 [Spirochaetia bacterium 38H-sp]|uniref:Peptidase M17 n=1 Tax=Rarispira pelagica TaxID=3141764 RepID=A0ABU9U9E9_9SPIR
MSFDRVFDYPEVLKKPAMAAMQHAMKLKANEKVLIITNPVRDVALISSALYDAAVELGAIPTIVIQPVKTLVDFAEPAVIAALETEPDVVCSISAEKLGKDKKRLTNPEEYNGQKYYHIHDFLREGKKTVRSFWSPSITIDTFVRTVAIDYIELQKDCSKVAEAIKNGEKIRVTAPGGTDIEFSIAGRKPFVDDGNFSEKGEGGNLPAGEVFISPALESAEGTIFFDGSISLVEGVAVPRTPVKVEIKNGYVSSITGDDTAAEQLEASLKSGEQTALERIENGSFDKKTGERFAKNARHLGEFGIGLNRAADIVGNMLEDEKVYGTCHFAIGSNYDNDAEALIHLDALVKSPTIEVIKEGKSITIMKDGELIL